MAESLTLQGLFQAALEIPTRMLPPTGRCSLTEHMILQGLLQASPEIPNYFQPSHKEILNG